MTVKLKFQIPSSFDALNYALHNTEWNLARLVHKHIFTILYTTQQSTKQTIFIFLLYDFCLCTLCYVMPPLNTNLN